MKPTHARVHFNHNGTPVADDYDDVYFSNDSGVQETLHVFMAGNGLPERWLAHQEHSFVIGESGFGTGLNCLVAMSAFARFRKDNPAHPLRQLFLVTTEKFPLAKEDIEQALKVFPELGKFVDALLEQYPVALEGCHRLIFDHSSTIIDLWIGDIHDSLPQWRSPSGGLVDAWFLDGFAPSKNPDMWIAPLFAQLARLSKPAATFATFTAAGVVKRGLQEAGFTIAKQPGFGRKRDMLTGSFADIRNAELSRLPCYPPIALTRSSEVAVIGGGLAAANLANALTARGLTVTLYCAAGQLADGASGNLQGGFYPQLHAQASYASQIQAHSFLYASREYSKLASRDGFIHQFCGVLQLAFNKDVAARQQKMLEKALWPTPLLARVDQTQAEAVAGMALPCGGIFMQQGGWINPPSLISSLLAHAQREGLLTIRTSHRLLRTMAHHNRIKLVFDGLAGETVVDHVILATGHESVHLPECKDLPLRPVRGQVEAIPAQPALADLKTVLCHKGYLTPLWQGRQALGSTYIKGDLNCEGRATESRSNIELHQNILFPGDTTQIAHDGVCRASVRLGAPDHQPLMGRLDSDPLPEPEKEAITSGPGGISILTALGSRGLTTAPLMAEIVASELFHQPLPLPGYLLDALHPQRFAVKQQLKQS